MALSIGRTYEYIPEYGGQREADSPVKFHLVRMDNEDQLKLAQAVGKVKNEKDGIKLIEQALEFNSFIFDKYISSIDNLEISNGNGKMKPIKTGKDFAESAMPKELVMEVGQQIQTRSELTTEDKKKSEST